MSLKIFQIELRALTEALRMSLRHPRYFMIFLAMWLPAIVSPIKTRKARWGYVFLQVIDDLLDGHRKSKMDPLALVQSYRAQFVTQKFEASSWGALIEGVRNEFTRDPNTQDSFVEILDVIDNMIIDYNRRMKHEVWSEETLLQHHRETFIPSLNLMIMSYGSNFRVNNYVSFVDVMGWCSVVRDLRDDLSRGVVNIPSNILQKANLGPRGLELQLQNPELLNWRRESAKITKINYDLAAAQVSQLDPAAQKIVKLFLRSAKKYLSREIENAV